MLLQARLGIHGCPAFSVEAACTGFIYALSIADKYVRCGESKCALVIGAETLSRIVDWNDRQHLRTVRRWRRRRRAEACRMSRASSRRTSTPTATYKDLLYYPGGVSTGWPASTATGRAGVQMKGNEVFKVAVNTLGRIVDETLETNQLDKSAIDWLVPHQANMRIIQATAKKLELPMERVIVTVQEHGNTSAASVPMALDVGVRDGRIKRGDLLLLEAFGGGFTWGSALVRY